MKNLLKLLVIVLVLSISLPVFSTTGLDWAMFRTYTSPAWVAGENGLITIPTTEMLGSGKLAIAFSGIDAGELFGERLLFSTLSAHFDIGNFLEVGITKKAILQGMERTDIEGETLHAKLRILKGTMPIAVGATVLNLNSNPANWEEETTFFNAFGVVALKLGTLTVNTGVEAGLIGDKKTEPFFFAGVGQKVGQLLLMGELVGTNEEGKGGLFNAGVSYNVLGSGLRIGVSGYDLTDEKKVMVQTSMKF